MFPYPPWRYCTGSSERSIVFPQMSARTTSSETTVFFATRKGNEEPRLQLAERPDEAQHLGGVAAGIDSIEHVSHGAVLVDDESRAGDAGLPGPVGFFLVHDAVFPTDFALGVGGQRDRDAVLVSEARVADAIVRAHAEHHAIVARELLLVVREVGRLQGAVRCPVLGIEVEHDVLLATELAEIHRFH